MRCAAWTAGAALVMILSGAAAQSAEAASGDPPRTVYEVDLERYTGLWYEIARIPNRFQNKCARNVTAEYRLREDGRITVINRCEKENGEVDRAEGVARIRNAPRNSQLEVSFVSLLGKHLFWGDYWILELGENYEYAVVGHPERKYGWILSRTPALSAETTARVMALLREQGYDPGAFTFTNQTSR